MKCFYICSACPIKYFDTNAYGDVMSYYTNDTDTLRQMISQSIPQTLASVVTVITVFAAMLATNLILTAFVVVSIMLMLWIAGRIGGNSAAYFMKQQKTLGALNGYTEEMINGQKVVKVFNHENESLQGFNERNDELFECAAKANTFANILMPIMGNLGNLQYVLIAIIGGGAGYWRGWRAYARWDCCIFTAEPQLYHADYAGEPTAECNRNGTGWRGPDFQLY